MSAFQSALNHLGGGRSSVIKMYNDSYDTKSDSKMAQYSREIEDYERQLEEIEKGLLRLTVKKQLPTIRSQSSKKKSVRIKRARSLQESAMISFAK